MDPETKLKISLTSAGVHLADLTLTRIKELWYIRGYTKEGLVFSAIMHIETHMSQISARIKEDLYE
jgi:hypothetical protein